MVFLIFLKVVIIGFVGWNKFLMRGYVGLLFVYIVDIVFEEIWFKVFCVLSLRFFWFLELFVIFVYCVLSLVLIFLLLKCINMSEFILYNNDICFGKICI